MVASFSYFWFLSVELRCAYVFCVQSFFSTCNFLVTFIGMKVWTDV